MATSRSKRKKQETRPGELLQSLVKSLEQQAHRREDVTVESPKFLPDKVTSEPREHDVVITFREAHHSIITALECRDRSRKVTVNEVDEFSEKCRDTGVHRGVIVSARGFTASALKKATFKNIGCFTLSEAQGFDWCEAKGIFSRIRRVVGGQLLFEGLDTLPTGVKVYEDGVGELDQKKLFSIALGILNGIGPDPLPGELEGQANVASVRDETPKIYLKSPSDDVLRPRAVILNITYEIDVSFVPFDFHQYDDTGEAKQVGEVASAMISAGDNFYRLAIAGSKDGPKRVTIQPLGSTSAKRQDRRQKKNRSSTR